MRTSTNLKRKSVTFPREQIADAKALTASWRAEYGDGFVTRVNHVSNDCYVEAVLYITEDEMIRRYNVRRIAELLPS